MAGMGAGYDLSVSTFSPDGRVFQVEYAAKAVDNSGTTIALVCKDGIIFGVEKFVLHKTLLPNTNRRIFAIDRHVGMAVAGLLPDARQIVQRARSEASNYKKTYGEPIPPRVLAERIALFVHAYTLYWSVRPFGASILLGAFDAELEINQTNFQGELYCIEPSGTCYKYFGNAIGKGKQSAKTEIEKLKLNELTCEEAVFHLCKILNLVHDESKEKKKKMEVEIAWISPQSKMQFDFVPKNILEDAEKRVIQN